MRERAAETEAKGQTEIEEEESLIMYMWQQMM